MVDLPRILEFVETLARRKNWKLSRADVKKALRKPHLRFVYFPIRLQGGGKGFFKLAPQKRLLENLRREREFLRFLEKQGFACAPKVLEFGSSWEVLEFLEGGVLCREEATSVLNPKWAKWVVYALSNLQNLSSQIPPSLLEILPCPRHQQEIQRVREVIIRLAEEIIDCELVEDFPFEAIKKFLARLPPVSQNRGLVVHGDLAPNNAFFSPQEERVVFLDWEWVRFNPNPLVAKSFDFANFYLRCWQNPAFQSVLEREWCERDCQGGEEFVLSIVFQGIGQLVGLCRFRREKMPHLRKHIRRLIDLIGKALERVG